MKKIGFKNYDEEDEETVDVYDGYLERIDTSTPSIVDEKKLNLWSETFLYYFLNGKSISFSSKKAAQSVEAFEKFFNLVKK